MLAAVFVSALNPQMNIGAARAVRR